MTSGNKSYKIARLPDNELDRLAALRRLNILDSTPQNKFDDLVNLASTVLECPIVLVSLVDSERQWFMAKVGIDACETSRDIAFCAHAILEDGILEVTDALLDDRFAGNPLVVDGPRIRFYAGAPLKSGNGYAYGTLCLIDTVPRKLSARQRSILQLLSRQVVALLESRQEWQRATHDMQTLYSVLESLPDGVITCDLTGRMLDANASARLWCGIDPRTVPLEQWQEHFKVYMKNSSVPLDFKRNPLSRLLEQSEQEEVELVMRAAGQPDRYLLCKDVALNDMNDSKLGSVIVMHDITSMKMANQEIANTRRFLQTVIDSAREVAIITTDAMGMISLFNTGAEHFLGYKAADVVGKHTPLLYHDPDELELWRKELGTMIGRDVDVREAFVYLIRQEKNDTRVWTWVRRDGSRRKVRVSLSALHDEMGKITGYLAMAVDLTSQFKAQESARINNAMFAGAFESAAQGMALVSLDGRWLEVNESLCAMLGYNWEELRATSFQSLTHQDDLEKDLQLLEQLLKGEIKSYQLEKRYIKKNGELMYGLLSVSLVRDSDGAPLYFVSQIQDITRRIKDGEALAENERFLRALFEGVVDAIVVLSANGTIINFNMAAEHLLGLYEDGNQNIKTFLPVLGAFFAGGQDAHKELPEMLETEALVGSGDPVPVTMSLSEVVVAGSTCWVAVLRDLSEQKRIERMKNDFVSTVSHELRTPLTAITGALTLIEGGVMGEVPENMKEMLSIASQNSERLTNIINDLLDMDKLIAGKMHFSFERVELAPLLDEALESMLAYAEPYQVKLQRSGSDTAFVNVDSLRLMQLLTNLLSNACKFSPRGGTVTLHYENTSGGVVVSVCDEGEGIPESFRDRIFQKFSQAETTDTRSKGGTGLGLVICKELVEKMHGSIGFESVPGQGTCFWFRLPGANATEELVDENARYSILVVEDDPVCIGFFHDTLITAGYQTFYAGTCAEAKKLLKTRYFDLLVLDLILPDGNGLDLLHDPQLSLQNMPVMIVTEKPSDESVVLQAGVSALEWQKKPVHPQVLLNGLKRLLGRVNANQAQLLLLTADENVSGMLESVCQQLGTCVRADSLAGARLGLAATCHDLVLLDLELAPAESMELWKQLRSTRPWMPVVVLSATAAKLPLEAPLSPVFNKAGLEAETLQSALKKLLGHNQGESL